jgi:CRP-like cAMP-binding protein
MTTERWTDERLDRLAALVESNSHQIESNSEQIIGLRESIAELRESSREQREDISALQITARALLQLAQQDQQKWDQSLARHEEHDERWAQSLARHEESNERWAQSQARHAENEQRFQIVLAELRHLIARMDGGEGAAAG